MEIIKRNGKKELFNPNKIKNAIKNAFKSNGLIVDENVYDELVNSVKVWDGASIEDIQDQVIETLRNFDFNEVADYYLVYRYKHKRIRDFVTHKIEFIENYKKSSNTANATIDDNSNVASKNIGILNAEIHKEDNINISRGMVMAKLRELYPDFNAKQYIKDLENHIIYKHDESSFAGAVSPYCCSITMYPFLTDGIKGIGGLSAKPKNLDSFCGMYVNLIFAVASQFAGAVATSEFLLYFDYFCKKEWGEDYWKFPDRKIKTWSGSGHYTILDEIQQKWQQVIYSINQPAASRGMQSAFVNFSYFDEPFFEGMFGDFYFPDGVKPTWDSLCWLQKEFMRWFNAERLKCIITFPVESFALVYKDGKFLDEDSARFVAEEYARGHSFFTYISDTVDSLSSCCRLKNMVTTKEFNFTNGNMGVQTGSKSVITLNLNRIVQDWYNLNFNNKENALKNLDEPYPQDAIEDEGIDTLSMYISNILERVYKYHTAYNELLWDMYNANLLPVYKAGFIDLNKQYLTIGLNGLNQAAEFLGIKCSDNEEYKSFCQTIFSIIKKQNTFHKTKKLTFNTEQVPAESLAIKNYNWDKADKYWVPQDTNLYASYIFKPNDPNTSILEKLRLHGKEYIGEYLDGRKFCLLCLFA